MTLAAKLKAFMATNGGSRAKVLLMGAGATATFTCSVAYAVRRLNKDILRKNEENKAGLLAQGKLKKKDGKKVPKLDNLFLRRMLRLLKIVMGDPTVPASLLSLLGVLYMRTMASIMVARLDGRIVQAIVSRDFRSFVRGLSHWMLLALPAVFINSMIKYLTGVISLKFRTRLVKRVHEEYLASQTYYKVCNLDGRISNADQMITADVNAFCTALSRLYTDVSKPMMDLILYSYQLWGTVGAYGPGLLMGFYVLVGGVLRFSSPPFGQLAADGGALEGTFRYIHSRLIQNCEEVAFYGGAGQEKTIINDSFDRLRGHVANTLTLKVPYAVVEAFSLKYVASVLIFCINGAPVFFSDDNKDSQTRTGEYMVARRLLLDMAAAIQRVMEAYKEVTELSGYAARVCNMLEVFDDMKENKYARNVSAANQKLIESFRDPKVTESEDGTIDFKHVPIVTPNGDVLVKDLTMTIKPGMHLLITGPNGCGKSSLFRTLGGLWPVLNGQMRIPRKGDLFYIPQRPYLSLGTFQEQIIYPHSVQEFERVHGAKGMTFLANIMEQVNLAYVVSREGGWTAQKNWMDRLSGGEKQRVGMARLFYHKPRYAILDECTSQVSIDVEGKMYQHAKDIGITLLTVSHRPSLWQYHNFVLQFDGEGGLELEHLEGDHRMSLEQEKSKLELQLAEVPKIKLKLEEVNKALGFVH